MVGMQPVDKSRFFMAGFAFDLRNHQWTGVHLAVIVIELQIKVQGDPLGLTRIDQK